MDLNISISPDIVLSPQLIQKMSILEMDAIELQEFICQTVLENPLLDAECNDGEEDEQCQLLRKKVKWLNDSDGQNGYYYEQDSENDIDPLSNVPSRERFQDLSVHLVSQLQKADLSAKKNAHIARYIIDNLDDDGYLRIAPQTLAYECQTRLEEVMQALCLVQSFDPAGVGARNLSECLCLQLTRIGKFGLPLTIASSFLEALSKNHYHFISKETGSSEAEVRKACDLIRTLDPKPGSQFQDDEATAYIRPDMIIVIENGDIKIEEDRLSQNIAINDYYASLLRSSNDKKIRSYVADKLRQAQWVIKCVEQRRSTVLKCAEYIVDRQKAFFLYGHDVKPLLQADVAEALGLHESTISRAVKGKYLQCKDGVHPMTRFFSRPVNCKSPSETSTSQTKTLIRQMIDIENKAQPYSDQNLCEQLHESGIRISRRTVAKYREELGIRSTLGRRRY